MYDSAGSTPQSSMSAAQQDYAYENIHWEKTQSWDIGVDAAFFNNRLDFSADYYYKKDNRYALVSGNPVVYRLFGT